MRGINGSKGHRAALRFEDTNDCIRHIAAVRLSLQEGSSRHLSDIRYEIEAINFQLFGYWMVSKIGV